MHHNAHRFSVEWARVEPEPGRFDRTRSRTMRTSCAPAAVTAWNRWSRCTTSRIPVWLAEAGGFAAPEAPVRFARYAAACAEALGRHGHVVGDRERTDRGRGARPSRRAVAARRTVAAPNAICALRGLLRMHAAAAQAIMTVSAHHGRACAGLDRASRASPRSRATRRQRRSGACAGCPISFSTAGFSAAASRDGPSRPSDTARWCPDSQGRSPTSA